MYKVILSDERDNFLVFDFADYGDAVGFMGFAIENAVGPCEAHLHKGEEVKSNDAV